MSQFLSHAHVELIINGHRFVGWAEDDPPYEWEFEDAAEFKEGQDGGLYGIGNPRLGGVLTFKLQPASPSTQWSMQQEQLRKNAHIEKSALRVYAGSFSDPVQSVSWQLEGGVIQMLPATRVPNQTYEGKIRFEKITANVDGGTFHPPLTSDAAAAATA